MDKKALAAWKNAGESLGGSQFESSDGTFEGAGVGKKKHGRHKKDKDMYISVFILQP